MVSSNCVHSTYSCEANKCRIFKHFFCLSDKRFLNINIKKKFEEDKSQGAFFTAQKCVFWGVNILSSKSYTVTKSGISPQRKLGSLRNLKFKFTRYVLTTKFFSRKDPCTYTHVQVVNARTNILSCVRAFTAPTPVCMLEIFFGNQLLSYEHKFQIS